MGKGNRFEAARKAGAKAAAQSRRTATSRAAKRRPSRRGSAEEIRRKGQMAATSRAKAAAASQRLPNGMDGAKADTLPVHVIGGPEAAESTGTLDWTAPATGRGSGGAGGAGAANGEKLETRPGFWAALPPLGKLLVAGAAGFALWQVAKNRK